MTNLRQEYDWFLTELRANGYMDTDIVIMNYITLDELYCLEEGGVVRRLIDPLDSGIDFIVERWDV